MFTEKTNQNIKIMLVTKASGNNYSIEAGLYDGIKNFDHHGEFSNQTCPAWNGDIKKIEEDNAIIEITHIDCDTFIGIMRLLGIPLPKPKVKLGYPGSDNEIYMAVISAIDLNGPSNSCYGTSSHKFFVGVGQLAKKLNFPRVTKIHQDVTNIILQMLDVSISEIVSMGWEAIKLSENTYVNCRVLSTVHDENGKLLYLMDYPSLKIGYWIIGPDDPFDTTRPYRDLIDIVVVYNKHWKTISIYCDPKSQYEFAGKEMGGILFQGHPKACGSPRGKEMTEKDGRKVFDFIINNY